MNAQQIPRDQTCFHCRRGDHARCVYRDLCACYECLAVTARAVVQRAETGARKPGGKVGGR